MDMSYSSSWIEKEDFVDIDGNIILVQKIDADIVKELDGGKEPYKIGIGDKISITVWGVPDIFPLVSMSTEQSLRSVNTDGTIYFPYTGSVYAVGLTQVELRKILTEKLSSYFNEPQLDVSIARFESQKVYILGEVTQPKKLSITETPLSLSDALGEVFGLNTNTSAADEVFVIRHSNNIKDSKIYRADLSAPSGFLLTNKFYLEPYDIVYVNAKGTTKWNRVVSQFFFLFHLS